MFGNSSNPGVVVCNHWTDRVHALKQEFEIGVFEEPKKHEHIKVLQESGIKRG